MEVDWTVWIGNPGEKGEPGRRTQNGEGQGECGLQDEVGVHLLEQNPF